MMTLSVVRIGLQYPSSRAAAAKLQMQSSSATALAAADKNGLKDSSRLMSSVQMLICSSQPQQAHVMCDTSATCFLPCSWLKTHNNGLMRQSSQDFWLHMFQLDLRINLENQQFGCVFPAVQPHLQVLYLVLQVTKLAVKLLCAFRVVVRTAAV